MICQNCGSEHSSKYCPECGTPSLQMTVSCTLCGFGHTSKFCPECGTAAQALPGSYYQHPPEYRTGEEPVVYTRPLPQSPPAPQPAPAQPAYPPAPVQAPTLQATSAQATPTIIINNTNENNQVSAGANAPYPPAPPGVNFIASPKSKLAALLLCVFFGYWGVHYFYVGKIGTGLLYLFTMGLFGIGWLVDIARIAMGGFRDNWGYPLVI